MIIDHAQNSTIDSLSLIVLRVTISGFTHTKTFPHLFCKGKSVGKQHTELLLVVTS